MSKKLDSIVNALKNGQRFSSGSFLITSHGNAYSYDVCIYNFEDNVLHNKKYSSTTSTHQNLVRQALEELELSPSETSETIGELA